MAWARRIVPPGWFVLALLGALALQHWLPIAPLRPLLLSRLGIPLVLAGSVLSFAGLGAFTLARTPVIPFRPSTALVTTGVYRFTRNPMYLGLTLILAGTGLSLASLGALVPLPLFVWIMEHGYIRPEERFLEEIFGSNYLRYKSEVSRWL
jgi:protein-S-isoprenylcysteine O-methyltransferase Ste14